MDADLKNLLRDLAESADELTLASQSTEQQFLGVAKALHSMGELSRQLVQQTEALVGVSINDKDEALPAGIRLVNGLLDFLSSGNTKIGSFITELERERDRIRRLKHMDTAVQQMIAPLQAIHILFKIESSRHTREVQERFTSLGNEICRLNVQVRDIFSSQFETLLQTEESITKLAKLLREQSARQAALLQEKHTAISRSMAELQQEMNLYETREGQLHGATSAIAREVGQVVMALQGQDNIAQRIQHVRKAIDQVLDAARPDSASPLSPADSIHVVSRIEREQLQAIKELLAPAQVQILSGIRNVESLVEGLNEHCLTTGGGQVSGVVQRMVQVLLVTLDEMHAVVVAAVSQAEDCHRQVRQLDRLATNLMAAVRQVATQMHLMGVNAEIQAMRVVGGRVLQVLSSYASEIACDTSRLSQKAATELDDFASSLGRCIGGFAELSEGSREKQAELDRQGVSVHHLLEAFRDKTVTGLTGIDRLLDGIRQNAAFAVATMDFENTMQPPLDRLENMFSALESLSTPPCESAVQQLQEWLQSLAANYTMSQEREIHSGVLASLGLEPGLEQHAETLEPVCAGGDIEFF